MDIKEQKAAIRKEIAAKKKSFSADWRCEQSKIIIDKLESTEQFINSQTVLIYHALPDEVQTTLFLDKWYDKKRLVLPVVDGDNLILKLYDPQKITKGYCSIPEPTDTATISTQEIELAVVPGVAFDKTKGRLGRGRGFYDRLLPEISCDIVGLGFEFQVVENVPLEPFDFPLSFVITEKNIY